MSSSFAVDSISRGLHALDGFSLRAFATFGPEPGGPGPRAERVGFEPTEAVTRLNGLASRRYKPLCHLSESKCKPPPRDRLS
jgi:hypothetical protein